jgi:hypothetical protein
VSLSGAVAVSLAIARFDATTYNGETHRRWQRIAVQQGAIYSSRPLPLTDDLMYQSIEDGLYTLRLCRRGSLRGLLGEGNALRPELLARRDLVRFESVRAGVTQRFTIDPVSGVVSLSGNADLTEPANLLRSPDGKWVISERTSWGQTQLYLVDRIRGTEPIQITGGRCSSFSPAWERDGLAIVFASDCGRGVGMPALYRAALSDMLRLGR